MDSPSRFCQTASKERERMDLSSEGRMQKTTSIPPRTRLGPVELTIASLDRQIPFYQDYLGLRLRQREPGRAELGGGGETLLRLIEPPAARRLGRPAAPCLP